MTTTITSSKDLIYPLIILGGFFLIIILKIIVNKFFPGEEPKWIKRKNI